MFTSVGSETSGSARKGVMQGTGSELKFKSSRKFGVLMELKEEFSYPCIFLNNLLNHTTYNTKVIIQYLRYLQKKLALYYIAIAYLQDLQNNTLK